ncbi:hypothetical protein B6A14_09180 [Polynucleobacter hirudinilacicola]|uniref:Cadherin domain-containing protein n=1 Tax=Polynucleobacter hirudinilacicola TaxID=1743166 RepID=A0A210RY49_9BURK|nr:VCBS domain-containing protein [Polynucleobacter hirudinilacicola]OWF65919.1 hypothetical protein B6A14_09180 [Polynucleobacter hirudinilacicola]
MAGEENANVNSAQQAQDAQHLDDMTSLQQNNAPDQGEARADAASDAQNAPAQDQPSLFNNEKSPNNNQSPLNSRPADSPLDGANVASNPGDLNTTAIDPNQDFTGKNTEVATVTVAEGNPNANVNPTIVGGRDGNQPQGAPAAPAVPAVPQDPTPTNADQVTPPTDTTPALLIDPVDDGGIAPEIIVLTPELSIWKTGTVVEGAGDLDTMIEAGESQVAYSVIVQNTGNQTLSSLTIADDKLFGSLNTATVDASDLYEIGDTITFEVGTYNGTAFTQNTTGTTTVTGTLGANGVVTLAEGVTLAPGQALQLSYDYVITQDDLDVADGNDADGNAELDNLAIASSDQTTPADPDTPAANDGKATYTVELAKTPELSIWKTGTVVEGAGDLDTMIEAGESQVAYSVIVQNTGNQTLSSLTIADDKLFGSLNTATVDASDLYEIGDTITFEVGTYNGTAFTQNTTGTTTVTGTLGANGVVTLAEGVTLAPGQALQLSYDYVITQDDLDVADGNDADGNAELDNLAIASSDQTTPADRDTPAANDGKATYTVELAKTPDLLITKSAVIKDLGDDFDSDGSGSESSDSHDDENENNNSSDDDNSDDENNNSSDDDNSDDENNNSENEYRVENNNENDSESSSESDSDSNSSHHSVDSSGDLIEYTLTVQNTGNTTLTNVLVYDTMFVTNGSHISPIKINGELYDGEIKTDLAGKSYIEIDELQVGETILVTYSYEVQIEDLNYTIETISSSDMSFSTSDRGMTYDVSIDGRDYVELSAYVNNNVVYDSNRTADLDESQNGKYDLGGTDAPIKMSSDTGAFTAGVAGNTVQGKYFGPSETKGYQEHMVATFNQAQAVKGGGFTITNVGDAEVALAVKFTDGSIKIQSFIFSQNSPDSYSAGFTGTKASDNANLIKVTNSGDPISSAPGFQIQKVVANDGSEESGSDHNSGSNGSGATNVLWNISYTNSEDIVSIDIWAVGNPRNTSSEASFKVVDFGIDVPVYQASQIDNVAGADSDQTGLESVALSVAIDDHISADGSGEADIHGETEEGDSTISGENSSRVDEEHESKSTGGRLVAHSSGGDETFFVAYEEADGDNGYGKFSVDMDGTWTYSMNSAYDEFEEGRNYTDSITVTTADGTTQLITVTIAGTNDAAVISGTSTASLTETNAALTTTGTLTSTDVDGTANAFIALPSTAGNNGYGKFTMTSGGAWTYTADTANNEFVSGTNYTDSVTVQAADGTNKTITVTIAGTNDAPVISAVTSPVAYTEGGSAITLDSAITLSDSDSSNFNGGSLTVSFTANGTAADQLAIITSSTSDTTPSDGTFSTNTSGGTTTLYYNPAGAENLFTVGTISSNGANGSALTVNFTSSSVTPAVVEALIEKITYANTSNNPSTAARTVTFSLNDGDGGSTNIGTAEIIVDVTAVNNAAVISGTSTASLTETNAALTTTGTLTSTDVDGTANAFIALPSTAGNNGYGKFTMTSGGAWTYTADTANNEFVSGTNYTDSVTVQAADGTNKTITVTIAGTNDAAVISGTSTASLTETNAALTTTGTLTSTDVDGTANAFIALPSTAGNNGYGKFTMTSGGAWTYTADTANNEFVSGTNYTDSVTVQAADGTNKTITVTIAGTNDAPVISAVTSPVAYTEGGSAITLDSAITLSDSDSSNFNGGSLTVSFTANGTAADQLAIITSSTSDTTPSDGTFSTNTSGGTTTLYYNPAGAENLFTVGTISSNGANGSALTVNFTSSSVTPAVVEALIEKITYANTSNNPSTAARTVTFSLNDGDGGSTNIGTAEIIVDVTAVNNAAVISGTSTASLTETNAALTTTGTLTSTDVDGTANAFIALPSTAGNNGYGKFTMTSGGAWTYTADTANNEFVSGTNYTDSVTVQAADGTNKTITVTIAGTNDAPVISAVNSSAAFTKSGGTIVLDSAVTVSDADSSNFNGGSLTVSFTANGTAADQLAIITSSTSSSTPANDGDFSTRTSSGTTTLYYNPTGSGTTNVITVGTISSNGSNGSDLTINFSSSSVTPAIVEALIEKITYANTSNNPNTATRTVTFTLNDGDGGSTNIGTAAIDVSVSRAPIALDLDGNGINYLSTSAGVTHDFTNTGVNEATAWVGSGDGLLALQREDGTLNIVFSTQAGETDLQGLAKVYDSNKDNVFDSKDVDFAKFGAWQDVDSDGKVDAGEFQTLADRGIASLSLTSDGQVSLAANGDVIIHGETTFTTTDGTAHIAQDVSFATNGDFYLADFSALLSGADSVHSKISIDQDGATDSHSSLFVELGGQTYEIATMKGEELGGKDILSHFAGADGAKALDGSAWTEVVDITSLHGGPASVTAEGGALTNSFDNNGGDWTVVVKSGTATVDTANNQITFSSDHADNAVTITTADGTSHDIHNVDKIQWHG